MTLAAAFECGMAEPVIGRAFVGILEDVVSLVDLLEARLRGMIVGIGVGVVLLCELAIGALDVIGGTAAHNAKDFIETSLAHADPPATEDISPLRPTSCVLSGVSRGLFAARLASPGKGEAEAGNAISNLRMD